MTVYFVEPKKRGVYKALDRRVFRRVGLFCFEWAHHVDWKRDPDRARWYGYGPASIPANCKVVCK